MKLRNRERFCVASPCDCLTAVGLLRSHTASRRGDGVCTEVCFTGEIPYGGTEFTLQPALSCRNSWLPVLRCSVVPAEGGSVLTVDARCHWLVRGFMAVWCGVLLVFTLGGVLAAAIDGFFWEVLMAPAMLAFGVILSRACFQRPLNRARKDLCRILQGEVRE
ncbi:hypothetical protein [Dysosmobacter sp.]|uniref:hypothetical protein n=1 Tax=Dysosmobacter sp. TaxID=2591382 RepID=UPI002A84F6A5|nr:hypothetical protein [Dysosmobacter sp.]MDY3282871.1 hypothetical protein [Dysosmobacter sp.]